MKFDVATLPRLEQCSTTELRAELANGLTLTAETLYRLGRVWAELERRGEDLSDLRKGLAEYLPLIAGGILAAEAVVAFAGKRNVLRALQGVPLEIQRGLASGAAVQVIDPANPLEVIEMPLAQLPPRAVRLAIGDGAVRTPAQQRLAIRTRGTRRRQREQYRFRPCYDRATGTVTVGRMTFALADLLRELLAAAGPELPLIVHPDEYLNLRVRLTNEEMARLQEQAKNSELPDWELARKALRAMGLI